MNSMTIDQQFQVVTLTSKQWQVLSEALDEACDQGPPGHGWKSSELSSAIAAFRVQLENKSGNPWRAVIDDALVCRFLLNKENENDPKKALNEIINWEVQVSKDPRVSSDALFEPIPLSERGPEPEELDEFGRCWWGEGAPLDEPGAMCFWSLSTSEAADGSDTHFAPWWALPIPPPVEPQEQNQRFCFVDNRHQWC
jgi:hypothetical protein